MENDNESLKTLSAVMPDVLQEIAVQTAEESQVTVHCTYTATEFGDMIRIWPTTFLKANDLLHKSKLVHCENITLYPIWTELEKGQKLKFTLLFEGLPKSCISFDFIEEIPEPGGFSFKNIERNLTDVYTISIS